MIKVHGSFTGIRIGISTIKAFHDVTNTPCIGITSLMGLAYNVNFDGYICSLIDAKNDNVYYGLFDNSTKNYTKTGNYLSENINFVTEILKFCNKPIFFVGSGSIVHKDMLKSILKKNAIFSNDEHTNKLKATSIGISAFDAFLKNQNADEYSISPIYLKKSNAERTLEEKNNGN